jgi:hypothetical protein
LYDIKSVLLIEGGKELFFGCRHKSDIDSLLHQSETLRVAGHSHTGPGRPAIILQILRAVHLREKSAENPFDNLKVLPPAAASVASVVERKVDGACLPKETTPVECRERERITCMAIYNIL